MGKVHPWNNHKAIVQYLVSFFPFSFFLLNVHIHQIFLLLHVFSMSSDRREALENKIEYSFIPQYLLQACYEPGTLLFLSVFYCCVTNHHKFSGLNNHTCYLTHPVSQGSRQGLAVSFAQDLIRLKSRCQLGLQSHLMLDVLFRPRWLVAEFTYQWLYD